MIAFLKKISEVIRKRELAALCTVVATKGSTPLKAGARMLVWENGSIYGTVGGGAFEKSVIGQSLGIIQTQEPRLTEHHLTKDHDMCCGGTVSVYLEPVPIPYQLFIFGAGHIGRALSMFSSQLEFDVKVIDDRKNIFRDWNIPNVGIINRSPGRTIPGLIWDNRTFAVIGAPSRS